METLLVSLFVAFVSSIGFMAYKHPNAYRKMSIFIIGISFLVTLSVSMFDFGVMRTQAAIIPILSPEAYKGIDGAIVSVKSWGGAYWISMGVCIYATFLLVLPDLLKDDYKVHPDVTVEDEAKAGLKDSAESS